MMRPSLRASAAVALLAIPLMALAQTPSWEADAFFLPIHGDLYAAGGDLDVKDPVQGDLVVAGGNVRVTAEIGADVLAAGGQVEILGNVGDDVRAAGGNLRIGGIVKGDLVISGGSIVLEESAVVEGDVIVGGGDVDILGTVRGKLRAGAGNIEIGGVIEGGAEVEAGALAFNGTVNGQSRMVAEKMSVGPNARLQGSMEYWTSDGEVDFSMALQGGSGAVFNPSLARERETGAEGVAAVGAIIGAWAVFSLLASAIIIVLLMLVFPRTFREAAKRIQAAPWSSLLAGFLYFAAMPVLAVLLFVTLIGIPLGLFVLFLYVFSFVFATSITALVVARWLEMKFGSAWHPFVTFLVALLVVIGFKALWLIPVLGWLAKVVIMFMAFGGLVLTMWTRSRKTAA